MKVLIDTLLHIIPSLVNVASLIMLLLFIYAVLGMNLFATVMNHDTIDSEVNFRNFGISLLLLLRCATGENWNNIMNDYA